MFWFSAILKLPLASNLNPEESAGLVAFLKTLTDYDLISDEKFSNPFIE